MASIIKYGIPGFETNVDLEISLSLIESGFFPFEKEGKLVFLIKESPVRIKSLVNLAQLKLKLQPIVRPEFPTLSTEIMIKNSKGVSFKYDYFSSIESQEEMNLMSKLLNQTEIELFFFDTKIIDGIVFKLDKGEFRQLKDALNEINS